jgi:hypothetical protein
MIEYINETKNTNLYYHNRFGSIDMAILDNLEASLPDDYGTPRKTINDIVREIKEDPENYELMERLKYMEDHGI